MPPCKIRLLPYHYSRHGGGAFFLLNQAAGIGCDLLLRYSVTCHTRILLPIRLSRVPIPEEPAAVRDHGGRLADAPYPEYGPAGAAIYAPRLLPPLPSPAAGHRRKNAPHPIRFKTPAQVGERFCPYSAAHAPMGCVPRAGGARGHGPRTAPPGGGRAVPPAASKTAPRPWRRPGTFSTPDTCPAPAWASGAGNTGRCPWCSPACPG